MRFPRAIDRSGPAPSTPDCAGRAASASLLRRRPRASLIHVERQWDQYEGPIEPKSRSSRRTVPLLGILRDHLDEHLLRTGRSGSALVFGRSPELPFAPMAIGKRAKRAWLDAGLASITLHECRHTFASLLIDAGATRRQSRPSWVTRRSRRPSTPTVT